MDKTAQKTFMVRNGNCCFPEEGTTRMVQVRDQDDIRVQESRRNPGPGLEPHPSQHLLLQQQGSLLHQQGSVLRQQGAAVGLHLFQTLGQMSVGGLQLPHPVQSHSELQENQKRPDEVQQGAEAAAAVQHLTSLCSFLFSTFSSSTVCSALSAANL